jgi:hypothetical protein
MSTGVKSDLLWGSNVFHPALSHARTQSGRRFFLHAQVMYGWKTSEEFLGAGILPERIKERVPCNLERGWAQRCNALAPVSMCGKVDMHVYIGVDNVAPGSVQKQSRPGWNLRELFIVPARFRCAHVFSRMSSVSGMVALARKCFSG